MVRKDGTARVGSAVWFYFLNIVLHFTTLIRSMLWKYKYNTYSFLFFKGQLKEPLGQSLYHLPIRQKFIIPTPGTYAFSNWHRKSNPTLDQDKRQNQVPSPLLCLSCPAAVAVVGGTDDGESLVSLPQVLTKGRNAWWELGGKR